MAALEHNEQKLKLLRSKYDKLNSIADAVRTLEQTDALIELADDIAALETKVEKQRKKASVTQEEADEAEQQATAAFTSFVEQFNIYFTASSGLWWWHEYGEWHSTKADAFREKFRGYLGSADGYKLFQAILDEQGRKLNQAFYGWEDRPGYLNLLSMGSFCQPVEANSYHPIFDLLFCSLGGGKPENIGHLEKLILAKWQHPENYLLPCAVFADGGGTGKSVLVARFLVTVFGFKNVADNLSMEIAFGKFNKRIAGKAVVFANEAPEDKEDDKGILRVVHSPVVNIEAKGRDPIESVNTALYFIATNPKSGGYAIRLAYSDVDRRFSIMHGTKPLKWYVAQHYGLPHDDDDDAGWEKMTSELQYVLSDRREHRHLFLFGVLRDHLYDDQIDEMFAPLTMRLLPSSCWNLFIKTTQWQEFVAGWPKPRRQVERLQHWFAGQEPTGNLLMIPSRLAIALQDDRWILRQAIVWDKVWGRPEAVKDRVTQPRGAHPHRSVEDAAAFRIWGWVRPANRATHPRGWIGTCRSTLRGGRPAEAAGCKSSKMRLRSGAIRHRLSRSHAACRQPLPHDPMVRRGDRVTTGSTRWETRASACQALG